MLAIQSLIAVTVAIGVAVVWTMAFSVAGAIWQRREMRKFLASLAVTTPSQDSTQADERELVLH